MDSETFLRRIQNPNDPSLWEELMPELTKIAFGACRDLNIFDQTRQDVVQDVALKVFTDWHTFRGQSSLGTWIYSIARHRCLDILRRRRVRHEERMSERTDDSGAAPDVPEEDRRDPWGGDPTHVPETPLCIQQVIEEFEAREVRGSGHRMADILAWWVENSPTTEELAAYLGTTDAAAKQRKCQILRYLRDLCLKYCGHEDCSMSARL